VAAARERRRARFEALDQPDILTNAAAPAPVLDEIVKPDAAGQKLLRDAADAMKLTARGYHRVLKVARTLADLDGEEKVQRLHLAEALSYRSRVADSV
jgi:magnesium chelatase family protein